MTQRPGEIVIPSAHRQCRRGRAHHLERQESRGISPSRVGTHSRAVMQSSPEGEGIPPPRRSRGRALHSQSDGCAGAQGRDSSRPLPRNMKHTKRYRVPDRARNDTKPGEIVIPSARQAVQMGACASTGAADLARNLALTASAHFSDRLCKAPRREMVFHRRAARVPVAPPGGRGYSAKACKDGRIATRPLRIDSAPGWGNTG